MNSFVFAGLVPDTTPCWVKGTVTIDGNASNSDGMILSAIVDGEQQKNLTLDETGIFDFNSLAGNDGDTVLLKVCGVYNGSDDDANFTFTGFCQTTDAEPWIIKTIDVSRIPDGSIGCACDEICETGICVNPGATGVCSSTEYYCDSDGSCESAFGETTSTCSSDCQSEDDDERRNTGGGNTGSASYEDYVPSTSSTPTVSKTYDVLSSGSNDIKVNLSTIPVSEIVLELKDVSNNVKFIITKKNDVINKYTLSKVYSYIEISHTNLNNDNISNAKIRFKVDITWLLNNSLQKKDVILLRYDNISNSWSELQTNILNEDNNSVYYESISPGLSLFVISTKKAQAPLITGNEILTEMNTTDDDIVSAGSTSTNNDMNTASSPVESISGNNASTTDNNFSFIPKLINIILGTFVILILILVVVLYKKKNTGKQSTIVKSNNTVVKPATIMPNNAVQSNNTAQLTSPTEHEIEAWFIDAEKKGYNRTQLRQFLLNEGFNPKDVDDVVKKLGEKKL
ncbi:MAG: PGF-pre-PGF domain-containing protein [Candidatus Woesearchaeota archaeon]